MFNLSREETKVNEFPRYKVRVALTNKHKTIKLLTKKLSISGNDPLTILCIRIKSFSILLTSCF